ncbi:MAG TPA: hemerythrin domain-containing protein [Polyangia bacterium]|nr:hemerythrin domain-containing protein [Polyangia bacterium]
MNDSSKRVSLSSEARNAILAQHDELRTLTAKVGELLHLGSASASAIESVRAEARALYARLDEHMRFEESTLEAALSDVIGRGPELHAEIERDHEHQRATLAAAIAEIGQTGPSREELVQGIRRFIDLLLRDMDEEEQILLDAEVDALLTDGEGG